jgi:hypothetical protein
VCADARTSVLHRIDMDKHCYWILNHRSQQLSFYVGDIEHVATIPSNGGGRGASGSVRLLVVEDHEPFRRFVCSTLEKRTELQVIGEVRRTRSGSESRRTPTRLDSVGCRTANVEWNRLGESASALPNPKYSV